MIDNPKSEDVTPRPSKRRRGHSDSERSTDVVKLSESIYMFKDRTIGNHDNVYEGEVRSSVYGIRPCAIKFSKISEQNKREAEILNKLGSHTNVIAIIQSGTYRDLFEDRVYFALDKCHKENLRMYLANRKAAGIEFDLNQAIDFAKQIIVGVMYIHDNNVIHLDLKPSNILISLNLHLIKIADFGLSIVVKSPKSKVFHAHQFGTNGYRPIESFGHGEVSMRTDIFSLGTLLLHLLSNGNDVFGRDEHVFIQNVMNNVTDTSGLLVSNPVTTEHLIKCMVRKERCRRPTIREVFDHPCWSGKEVECNVEYITDDEIDDSIAEDKKIVVENIPDINRERKFVTCMKQMGFNRKPTFVVFDDETRYLYRFDHGNNMMTKMHKYPFTSDACLVISLGEYIYAIKQDGSVCRLEYCVEDATWEKISALSGDFDDVGRPCVVASSTAIFLIASYEGDIPSKSVFMYNPTMENLNRLNDKEIATIGCGVACSDDFLYCLGGIDENFDPTARAERMDMATFEWKRIADMNQRRVLFSAAEYRGNVYLADDSREIVMEMYDPRTDQWTETPSTNIEKSAAFLHHIFGIDGYLFFVERSRILKYNMEENEWSIVASYDDMYFGDAALVKMSA